MPASADFCNPYFINLLRICRIEISGISSAILVAAPDRAGLFLGNYFGMFIGLGRLKSGVETFQTSH